MTTRSLILSPHEIRAALDGRLGLVVRPVSRDFANAMDMPRGPEDVAEGYPLVEDVYGDIHRAVDLCPLGLPGDKLCCKESYYIQDTHGQHRADGLRWGSWSGLPTTISPDGKRIVYYREGFDRCAPCWRSPATMPAWASRITLEVRGVRCVRVRELMEEDAAACGFSWTGEPGQYGDGCQSPFSNFEDAWDAKYAPRYPWETSWAWAVGVRRVEG